MIQVKASRFRVILYDLGLIAQGTYSAAAQKFHSEIIGPETIAHGPAIRFTGSGS